MIVYFFIYYLKPPKKSAKKLRKIFKKHKIKLPSDIKMDKKILKIMDKFLICGTKENNTEGIICNKFQTSLEIINYIKKLTGNK